MFEKGEYIIYGNTGLCIVEDITTMNMTGISKDKLYYVLNPYNQRESRIFTPVDNKKTVMRKLVTKKQALELIDSIPGMNQEEISNDKQREEEFKEALKSSECSKWMKLIKSIYIREKERNAQGRKITATEERYLNVSEERLFSELSIPLEIPKEQVKKFISDRIQAIGN